MNENVNNIIELLNKSYSVFHNIQNIKEILDSNNFIKLEEKENFDIKAGNSYYLTRNNSSIIAFKVPYEAKNKFLISASHIDSPTFKIKPNPVIKYKNLILLNCEPYGGGIYYSWFDRPLTIAGRIFIKTNLNLIEERTVYVDKNLLTIPSLAIHMNRDVNNSFKVNPSIDTRPVLCTTDEETFSFENYLKEEVLENKNYEILGYDLFLTPREKSKFLGLNNTFISSPKLDNLASAYSSLFGFLNAKNNKEIIIYCCFDNEEVGSLTYQGAHSDFLVQTVKRIFDSLKENNNIYDFYKAKQNSFMLSIDNAHANHPNHPEISDATTDVQLNRGIVIKYNANQSYTSDSLSSSIVKEICNESNLKYQEFTNRSDLRGGSTLGNLSNSEISLRCVDIGVPQLAMHSSCELCGTNDINDLIKFTKIFFEKDIEFNEKSIEIK